MRPRVLLWVLLLTLELLLCHLGVASGTVQVVSDTAGGGQAEEEGGS